MVTLLDRMDRTSMYSGLEARVPFADHRIVEYLYNVPWKIKCLNGEAKGLLRAAGKEDLPPEVLYRRKVLIRKPMILIMRGCSLRN